MGVWPHAPNFFSWLIPVQLVHPMYASCTGMGHTVCTLCTGVVKRSARCIPGLNSSVHDLPYSGILSQEKILRTGKNTIFSEKTFADCSLLLCQSMPHSQILHRKLQIATKQWNSQKFSPKKSFPLYSTFLQNVSHCWWYFRYIWSIRVLKSTMSSSFNTQIQERTMMSSFIAKREGRGCNFLFWPWWKHKFFCVL